MMRDVEEEASSDAHRVASPLIRPAEVGRPS
jgi:hypothetical protein